MIGSIVIKHNPVLAWETYHRELHRSYEGGPGFSGYRHTIRVMGGFWQCQFKMHRSMADLVEFQASGHGRHVEVYGERGTIVWEGLIVEMEMDLSKRAPLAELAITCWGYFRTLYWMTYNQTALTGSDYVSTIIAAVITACGQFVGATSIANNPTLVTKEYDADRFAGDILFGLTKLGDSAFRRYVIGMYEGRRLIYEQAAPARLAGT
jgi:hypothetical protein